MNLFAGKKSPFISKHLSINILNFCTYFENMQTSTARSPVISSQEVMGIWFYGWKIPPGE